MAKWRFCLTACGAALLLSACGGGGGDAPASGPVISTPVPGDASAPVASGDTATDGYNWFNYRRAQLGLSTLTRNSRIDRAAQGHSDYQRLNNLVSHEQTAGQPGFTGATLLDRLRAAGYSLSGTYAAGEVISAAGNSSGFAQAEGLIAAIYHRFVIFEPVFREIGAGAATASGNYTYFTADLAVVNGYSGLGAGRLVSYPYDGQRGVPVNFFSDQEVPDPVPGQNEVGYPISVHADGDSALTVQSFTVAPRGGNPLDTRLLSLAAGTSSSGSAAAIVPLTRLAGATTYEVRFSGSAGGVAVSRNWSFTTQ